MDSSHQQEELWTTPASSLENPRLHKILLSHHGECNNAPACAAKVQEQPSAYATCGGHRMSNLSVPQPPLTPPEIAMFSYHRTTKTNAMKFMLQSLCNPPISLVIKAINAGFLKGAPHLTAKTVAKYLSPSPATSKGHMKWPCKDLRSTTPKPPWPAPTLALPHPLPAPSIHWQLMPGLTPNGKDDKNQPVLITDVDNESIANIFCFGAFANKNTGIIYNYCKVIIPLCLWTAMSLFFIMYHYETNAIFATPIPGLDSKNILGAYTQNFEYLVSKGYTQKST
jgi:hypothetical protein